MTSEILSQNYVFIVHSHVNTCCTFGNSFHAVMQIQVKVKKKEKRLSDQNCNKVLIYAMEVNMKFAPMDLSEKNTAHGHLIM